MTPDERRIWYHINKARETALNQLSRKVYRILRGHPELVAFRMGMGTWGFSTVDGEWVVDDDPGYEYLRPVGNYIASWEDELGLTRLDLNAERRT